MTNTTQTQVTGPVDDAPIDADRYATEMVMTLMLGTIRKASYQDIDIPMARKLGRAFIDGLTKEGIALTRLAPRADALIEREQVEAALFDVLNEVEDWTLPDLVNAVMAPRAPMPDGVTVRRDDLQHIMDTCGRMAYRLAMYEATSYGDDDVIARMNTATLEATP